MTNDSFGQLEERRRPPVLERSDVADDVTTIDPTSAGGPQVDEGSRSDDTSDRSSRSRRPGRKSTGRKKPKAAPRRRRSSTISFGHVVLIASGIAGFAGTLLLLNDPGSPVEVAVAQDDLASGTPLSNDVVALRTIDIDPEFASTLATPAELTDQSLVLAYPIEAGAFIPRTALVPADGSDTRARLSVPIPVERAVGGELTVGSRVHLIGVLRDDRTTFASFVAVDVEITDVLQQSSDGGLLGGSGSNNYFMTVALEPDDILAVTTVLGAGTIEVAQAPAGGGLPDISRSAVATEAGVVVVPRDTLINTIESEGRAVPIEEAADDEATPVEDATVDGSPAGDAEPAEDATDDDAEPTENEPEENEGES